MNSFSHIIIGKFLHWYLREHHGIELSRADFLYGNIIPDFRPAYKKMPHEKEYWTRYLKSEYEKLSAMKQEDACFGVNYSRCLGVICHFYADFFCFAHTEDFEGGSYPHILYELALHQHLKNSIPELRRLDFGGSTARGRDAATIQGSFTALQEQYLKEAPSYENDTIYTLRACIEAATAVAGNSVVQKKPGLSKLVIERANG